jgi:hypothetical protein
MPAPKGNRNAARPGSERAYRVRVIDDADHDAITLLDPYERGLALVGYLLWRDSPEHDDSAFIEWIKAHTDYGQYK